MFLRPNSQRIAQLLQEDAELREDLDRAQSADEADAIRSALQTTQHSLWLAGYEPEECA